MKRSDWEVIECKDKIDAVLHNEYLKVSCICGAVTNQPCFHIQDGIHHYRAKKHHEHTLPGWKDMKFDRTLDETK